MRVGCVMLVRGEFVLVRATISSPISHLFYTVEHAFQGVIAPANHHAAMPAGMFGFFFCEGPITCYEDAAAKADTAKFAKFHRGMLEEGVYLAPSQFEAGFTGLAHTEADIDHTIEAARRVLSRIPA